MGQLFFGLLNTLCELVLKRLSDFSLNSFSESVFDFLHHVLIPKDFLHSLLNELLLLLRVHRPGFDFMGKPIVADHLGEGG